MSCVLFLFEGAAVDTRTKYAFAVLGAFAMGFANDMIRWVLLLNSYIERVLCISPALHVLSLRCCCLLVVSTKCFVPRRRRAERQSPLYIRFVPEKIGRDFSLFRW